MTEVFIQMGLMQRLGFLLGWGCFALAFVAAAAENHVSQGFITPINDVLLATVPGKWIAFKSNFGSGIGEVLLLPFYYLPGWLIAGIPAGLLLWNCRPHREEVDPELYDSLLVFDRLAELAEEEKAANDDPTFQNLEIDEEDNDLATNDLSSKQYMEEWQINQNNRETEEDQEEEKTPTPEEKPFIRPKGPNERMEEARESMTIPFDKLT